MGAAEPSPTPSSPPSPTPSWLESEPTPTLSCRSQWAMDPTSEELRAIDSIEKVFEWVGVEDRDGPPSTNFRSAFSRALGGPRLVRQIVAIPLASYSRALLELKVRVTTPGVDQAPATVNERSLTPLEEGQVGTVRRVARLVMGLTPDEAGTPQPACSVSPAPESGAVASTSAQTGVRKIKLSTVLDQADDTEVLPLSTKVLRDAIEEWKVVENDGEDPAEDEEATSEQITALDFRIKQGATPYADFGIWRPHGARLGRILKFLAFFAIPGGGFQQREISGPSSFAEWSRAWRVFAFAMMVLKAATRARLEKYYTRISKLSEEYPCTWWIVALADLRMRSEHFERVRRRCAREHEERTRAGLPSGFNPQSPWDYVLREAARDNDFWREHVEKKALQFATRLQTAAALRDDDVGLVQQAQPGPVPRKQDLQDEASDSGAEPPRKRRRRKKSGPMLSPAPKAQAREAGRGGGAARGGAAGGSEEPRAKDGRYFRDMDGTQLCWDWNRSVSGCSEPCRHNPRRAHKCEWCRGNHRTVVCREIA